MIALIIFCVNIKIRMRRIIFHHVKRSGRNKRKDTVEHRYAKNKSILYIIYL